MTTKACPKCEKISDSALRVCTCGHTFYAKTPDDSDISSFEPVRLGLVGNYKINRLLALLAVLILSAAGFWAFFNYDSSSADESDNGTTRDSISKTEDQRNFAGNTTPKNLFEGVVTKVITGDAITIRKVNDQEHQVRLFGIAAPKMNDQFGKEAKESLSAEILGKNVRVVVKRIEDNGVIVGRVMRDDVNVCLEQIRKGFATHNLSVEQTQEEQKLFAETEAAAKNAKAGLWSLGEPPVEQQGEPDMAAVKDVRTLSTRSSGPSVPNAELSNPVVPEQKEIRVETQILPPVVATPKPTTQLPAPAPPASKMTTAVEPKAEVKPPAVSLIQYIRGPRGGCYYINSRGSKTYVDHSLCK